MPTRFWPAETTRRWHERFRVRWPVAREARPRRLAANLFAGVPFTGQFNLLTTGSFDSPKELFTADNFSRSIAYFSLAAPGWRSG